MLILAPQSRVFGVLGAKLAVFGPAGPLNPSFLLLETGDFFLLEDGDKLIL